MSALSLLAGDAQIFTEKVWASRTHLHHTEPDALVGLLSLDDVDHLLTSTAIRTPAVRVAQDGALVPESRLTRRATTAGRPLTGLVDARKVLDLFEGGATVILQGLQRYWPPLTELLSDLERELGHPCQANAYLTPPDSQGFAVHADTHDVFVVQTHGSKLWEIHEDEQAHDVLLQPGLSLYLPTGTRHAARAQTEVSLHVTIGINQLTWRTLVERVVADLLDELPDAHLPAGYLDDPQALQDGLSRRLDGLGMALAAVETDRVAAREIDRFLTQRPPRLPGGLRDRVALPHLADDTPLRRRTATPVRVVPEGDSLRIQLGDRELHMPRRIQPAIDQILDRGVLTPADLSAHLDESGRLVLCRRLVREGLLEVVR